MKRVLILLFASLICACTHKPGAVIDNVANGNNVIFLDAYYTDYLNSIKTDTTNLAKIYNEKIHDPIVNTYFLKCEYRYFAANYFSIPIHDTIGMHRNIVELNANKKKIDSIISLALTTDSKFLKNDSISVYIVPLKHYFKGISTRMGGITGETVGSKEIILTVDPEVTGWENNLKYAISHEYSHAYWAKIHPPIDPSEWVLLYSIIGEGKADSYAHIIYPGVAVPWVSALSDSAKNVLWNRIKPELKSTDINLYYSVVFGHDTSKIYPLWGGYSIGYAIVQSALKNNSQLTPEQWMALKPEELLKMSDYK